MRWIRRLALLEAALQAKDAPPQEGLSAILEWIRRHPPDEDNDPDPASPPSGLALLLREAKDFLKERNHG